MGFLLPMAQKNNNPIYKAPKALASEALKNVLQRCLNSKSGAGYPAERQRWSCLADFSLGILQSKLLEFFN